MQHKRKAMFRLDLSLGIRKRDLATSASRSLLRGRPRHFNYKAALQVWKSASVAVLAQSELIRASANPINYSGHIRHKGWRRYRLSISDLKKNLPSPLNGSFSDNLIVRDFLKDKDWSHIKSQSQHPDLATDPRNGFIENSKVNRSRGARDVTKTERVRATIDNAFEARKRLLTSPRVWRRLLGSSAQSALITAAIRAVEQLLIHRNDLINGSNEQRIDILNRILRDCGMETVNTFIIALIFGVAVIICPPLETALALVAGPGTVFYVADLIRVAIANPSRQEKVILQRARQTFASFSQSLREQYEKQFRLDLNIGLT